LARRDAVLLAVLVDELLDCRIGDGIALAGLVAIPAGTRLLPEASGLADQVGDHASGLFRILGCTALSGGPADVEAGQITHAIRTHGHAEFLQRTIDLLRQGAFVQELRGCSAVSGHHPVADETVAYAGNDSDLLDPLGQLHGG